MLIAINMDYGQQKINKSVKAYIRKWMDVMVKVEESEKMFKLHSEYKPTGDQPQAIEKLANGIIEVKNRIKIPMELQIINET